MIYRRLDENHDMSFGRGKQDFLEDSVGNPEAIAQAIETRLLLFLGEWWMDLYDGLPLWEQILGQRIDNKNIINEILIDRIKGLLLPDNQYGVIGVTEVTSRYISDSRKYTFSCVVDTIYGKVYITNEDQGGN
jgi:hypothetical protein